mmetsp:Transcript_82067/g.237945  ORF Transcript_82067/g.237945 Transcript_82067/m.237945 type:complete len:199 (+) Transcript_82067:172-768(+)|eukprot:CAMPEP_0176010584 /NCGR_PEP_ID=MMETSP0120_2-20121206/4844_1 /TAXON_ID=160619 /ORGANISM="Kryptoperidinium foliaceum, Strain CCMP 1326" /LENGTH=198 /DNA_ID=CAMNT_0017343421 /DNA_START=94 /DNA_END=690 /DNA_ORIENTATION=+
MDESSFYDIGGGMEYDDGRCDLPEEGDNNDGERERDEANMPPPAKRPAISNDQELENHHQHFAGNASSFPGTNKPNHREGGATTSDEFVKMVHDSEAAMKQKLEDNKDWVAKSVRELSTYAKALSVAHAEYNRILHLERAEAERLDRVEPDVQGATQHMLDSSQTYGSEAKTPARQSIMQTEEATAMAAGSKRDIDQV